MPSVSSLTDGHSIKKFIKLNNLCSIILSHNSYKNKLLTNNHKSRHAPTKLEAKVTQPKTKPNQNTGLRESLRLVLHAHSHSVPTTPLIGASSLPSHRRGK